MSEEEIVQLSLEDLYAPVSEEYIQEVKGQIQAYDEEQKTRKKSNFIKLGKEEQIIFFPEEDFEGNKNVGRIVWKAYSPKLKQNVYGQTPEEVKNKPLYMENEKEFGPPQRRHYVDVILLDKESGQALKKTFDMPKTVYGEVFVDHLTKTDRVLKMKRSSTDEKKTLVRYPKREEVAAIMSIINKNKK